jgi:hypothetical protein
LIYHAHILTFDEKCGIISGIVLAVCRQGQTMDYLLVAIQSAVETEISKAVKELRFEMFCTGRANASATKWRPMAERVQEFFDFADNVCLEWFRAQPGVMEQWTSKGTYPYGPARDDLDRRRAALSAQKSEVFERLQAALER